MILIKPLTYVRKVIVGCLLLGLAACGGSPGKKSESPISSQSSSAVSSQSNSISSVAYSSISSVASSQDSSLSASSSFSESSSTSSSASSVECCVIKISEAVASNNDYPDDDGDFSDWIELYHPSGTAFTLAGWSLTDDPKKPTKWVFPSVTINPGEHILIWASDKKRNNVNAKIFHTNFKLSNDETIYLFNAEGVEVHRLSLAEVTPGHSVGMNAQMSTAVFFETPTPGAANSSQEYSSIIRSIPEFSHQGGVNSPGNVSISGNSGNEFITYTLDGSIPTLNSSVYKSAIPVTGNVTLRARIFADNAIPSITMSRQFLPSAHHDLPVVTLITEPKNFFDQDTGIYVLGNEYEPQEPYNGANFWQDWERDIHFTFYEKNGDLGFAFDGGVKIFGGWSRSNAQRSLAIFARGRYGLDEIDYPIFPHVDYTTFSSLVLRNSGNDWMYTFIRDAALTSLMAGTGLDYQDYRSVVTYLNGEYWGIYNLREKVNEDFIATRHGVDADDVNLLEGNGVVNEGSNKSYLALLKYIENNDLSDSEHFAYVENQIDVDNFTIYNIAQIYFNNTDWPGNNIKFWNAPGFKWHWILYDTDFGFGIYNNLDYQNDTLSFALAENGPAWPNPPWSTFLMRNLLKNAAYKTKFVNQFADELNTRFESNHVVNHITEISEPLRTEVPAAFSRWQRSNNWDNNLAKMKNFAVQRPQYMFQHISSYFGFGGVYSLQLTQSEPSEGKVKLNSLTLTGDFTGQYFKTVSITLQAIPEAGYVFSHWQGDVNSTQEKITLTPNSNTSIKAVFIAAP